MPSCSIVEAFEEVLSVLTQREDFDELQFTADDLAVVAENVCTVTAYESDIKP